jgi:hypothetical protein
MLKIWFAAGRVLPGMSGKKSPASVFGKQGSGGIYVMI